MREVVLVTTYRRPEHLYCCLKRIRAAEPHIAVAVFPDRCTATDFETEVALRTFRTGLTQIHTVPDHDYHGNTMNTMEAFRWAYNEGFDRVFYVEDDVMVHPDFFAWHRAQHDQWPRIFATMAWIFNRHAPITDDVMFQPWYYAIGTCFARKKLELVVQHANPKYYADMPGYVEKTFPGSQLNTPFGIQHYEQDGLIQRVLDLDKTQTISPGITKCTHIGSFGYNRGWDSRDELFANCGDFGERCQRLEMFIGDAYWRAEVFGREIVEREIGHELPKRTFKYKIGLPGGWETEVVSERSKERLPKRINSVSLPQNAIITKV
jgi:hypothetical protein